MSTRAAQLLGHPPGLNFHPDDDELVAFFLLPSARGEPAWFPGVVVIEDDAAANTLPWNLLRRHGLDDDDEAYFLVDSNDAATARKDRNCEDGGRWVSQRPVPGGACIGGEDIKWRRINLNLHMGRGKRGGSTGWVMHEYTLTEPACSFVKICHVAFSGHGKDCKRVPDNDDAGEPASSTKRARIDAAANYNGNGSGSVAMMDQGYGAGAEHGLGEEGLLTQVARDFFRHLIEVTNTQVCPAGEPTHQTTISDQNQPSVAHASSCTGQQEQLPPCPIYQEGISSSPMAHQQQQMVMMPLPDDSQAQAGDPAANYSSSATTCAYGSMMTTVAVQDSGEAQFWSAGLDFAPQLMVQDIAGMAEQQYGGDQQEQQLFWDSIGVDTDNLF